MSTNSIDIIINLLKFVLLNFWLMFFEELSDAYQNEEFAVEAFKEFRVRTGITCKKCNCTQHYWLKPKQQFQCKECRFRTTLRSGTVLEGSKLPIHYFFIALHLLIKKGNALTVDELQENTHHKYYEPIWELLRKLKVYIRENEQKTTLLIFSEVAEEYFEKKIADKELVKV